MPLEDFFKQNATIVIWVIHGFIALYIYGKGTVLSYNVNDIFVFVALAVSLWVFNMLKKDLIQEQTKQPKVKYVDKKEKPKVDDKDKPFDLGFEDKPT